MGCCEINSLKNHSHKESNIEINDSYINKEFLSELDKIENGRIISNYEIKKSSSNSNINSPSKKTIFNKEYSLLLTVIESKFIEVNKEIVISPEGMSNSLRNEYDGYSYFGNLNPDDPIKNDFIFPSDEKVGNKGFVIRYHHGSYIIKDLKGSGLFMKINNDFPLRLKNNSVFSFINTHVLIQFSDKESSFIKVSVISNCDVKESKTYSFNKINNISFGRKRKIPKCDIEIDNPHVSKIQSTIIFKEGNWFLFDSDGTNETTNGTWILLEDYYKIYDNMIIRIGSTIFSCKLR